MRNTQKPRGNFVEDALYCNAFKARDMFGYAYVSVVLLLYLTTDTERETERDQRKICTMRMNTSASYNDDAFGRGINSCVHYYINRDLKEMRMQMIVCVQCIRPKPRAPGSHAF